MSTDALKLTEATLPGQGVSDPGGLAQGHLHGLAYYATPDNHPDVHFVSPAPVGAGIVPAQPWATTRVAPTVQLVVDL
jgi:hypothetical protein